MNVKAINAIGSRLQENGLVGIVSVPEKDFNRGAILKGILVFIGYYFLARAAVVLLPFPIHGTTFLFANSLLLAALLSSSIEIWWVLMACAVPAHLICAWQSNVPLGTSFEWFGWCSVVSLAGAAGTRLLVQPSTRSETLRSTGAFVLCAVCLAPAVFALLGAWSASLQPGEGQPFKQVWLVHFVPAVFANLILAPVILTWWQARLSPPDTISRDYFLEVSILFFGLVAANSALLFLWESPVGQPPALLCISPLFLIWAAVRLGPAITNIAVFTNALFLFLEAAHGRGPFGFLPPEKNLFFTQVYLIILSIPTLFLAVSIADREKVEARFSKIFRSNPEGIIISRLRDGCVIETNARWEQIFGYRHREAINRPVASLEIFATEADYSNLIQRVLSAQGWHDFELSLRTRSGEPRDTLISAEIDYIDGDNCLVLIIRDITDRGQAVLQERARIAQDIHDDLGARLTAISLLSDISQSRGQSSKEISSDLCQIGRQIQLCTQSIDEIVWAVSPRQDTVESFINYLQAHVSEALQPAGLHCRFQLPSPPPARHLMTEARHNLFMACREVINNIIKHSAATQVTLKVVCQDVLLIVTITDNGVGFDPVQAMQAVNEAGLRGHHGLPNLRNRLESVGGDLKICSGPGKGTCITLSVDFRKLETRLMSRPLVPDRRNSVYSS